MKVMVGGTFDPLHDGHKHLLNRSFEVAGPRGHVTIGLTHDTFASRKNHPIRPYALRKAELINFITSTFFQTTCTLQWASIGALLENERYQVIVEDVTAGQARRIVDYVGDTKYIVPTTFRPKDNLAHVMRWWIIPMRQTGSDAQGQPVWTSAGASSDKRDFTWVGAAVATTPTP